MATKRFPSIETGHLFRVCGSNGPEVVIYIFFFVVLSYICVLGDFAAGTSLAVEE